MFLKRFRWGGGDFGTESCIIVKTNVVEFYVSVGAWESYKESTRQPDGLCLETSHIHTTFNRDSIRRDKAN